MNMNTSTLKAVEKLDEVDLAARDVAVIQEKLSAKRAKLSEIEARLVKVVTDIQDSAMSDDSNEALNHLFKEKLMAVAAIEALKLVVLELEGQLDRAHGHNGEVHRARLLLEAQAKEPAAREAVQTARLAVGDAANRFVAAIVEHARLKAAHDDVRDAVAQGGRPVGPEEGTRAVLFSLGIGRGALPRAGFEHLPFPIPTGLPFS
jgi:hypothetical protein